LYSLVDDIEFEKKTKAEKHCFSIFICLWGIKYFLETLQSLGKYFKFYSVVDKSTESLTIIEMLQHKIHDDFKSCNFPDGWTKSVVEGI
jgi:cytochrome c oxidase subunit IV